LKSVSSGEEVLSGERVERRLAAILAADVAGYSRLMGEDEERPELDGGFCDV
jgi:class 3 adenylate cyclase